jgi:hypothetical protein
MIRRTYNWHKIFDAVSGSLDLLFIFSGGAGDLGGNQRLASNWIADFRRLYDFSEASRPGLSARGEVQPDDAHRHDARDASEKSPGPCC